MDELRLCLTCGQTYEPKDRLPAISMMGFAEADPEAQNILLHCPRCGSALTEPVSDSTAPSAGTPEAASETRRSLSVADELPAVKPVRRHRENWRRLACQILYPHLLDGEGVLPEPRVTGDFETLDQMAAEARGGGR